MSPVFATQRDSNKVTPTKGQKLVDVIRGAKLDDVGLYNWGTKDPHEINRALVELVGCQKVADDPLQSVLDPALGTGGAIYLPEPWKPDAPFEVGKTHTFKLKKRLPTPAVAITKLTPWFDPEADDCKIRYRLEGVADRADQTDLEVHVARYVDHKGESQSSYYEIKEERRETHPSRATASVTDNPVEKSEAACGTDDPTDTHIWYEHEDGVAPSPEIKLTWGGKSQAKQGVLGPTGSGAQPYINSVCAPYTVLLRYYKNDDDDEATITFDESFYPRWNVEAGGARKLDPASLVVKWTVEHDPNNKLVLGQLQVFDNGGDIVFRVALDESKIKAGTLDLAPLWPEAEIDRDAMPYRVQIQVHSGPDEPDGLALAVMPTQVRAFDYEWVQFLAFNVRPPSPYSGDPDHDTDIDARVAAMIDAVQEADGESVEDDNVLKVFMAPEFYFRGPAGAYPVEKLSTIVPKLREETDKIDYADWMFVFGSAIGYEKHEDAAGNWIVHKAPTHDFNLSAITATEVTATAPPGTILKETGVIPLVGWRILQGAKRVKITGVVEVVKYKEYKLTFARGPVFSVDAAEIEVPTLDVLETDPFNSPAVTRIRVKGRICSRIPSTTVGGFRWVAMQGAESSQISACAPHGATLDEFWLTLATPKPFRVGRPISLMEPGSTEVTNVALVQKGYPSPYMGDRSLRHVAIYKEKISPIDFAHGPGDWHDATAVNRKILIHGTPDRPVLPTTGSDDLAGASPNVTRKAGETAGSEINKTGIGGGVVYTMDDITFGLEVCLDHGKNRLADFYGATGNKAAGDPKVQVHLIPSWGMTVGGGRICCPSPNGTVFNVDGSRATSVALLYDGTWSCDEHPTEVGTHGRTCTRNVAHYQCPLCSTFISDSPGNCDFHTTTALVGFLKCGGFKYWGCFEGHSLEPAPCTHASNRPMFQCASCKALCHWGTTCTCPDPNPQSYLCGNYYTGAACNKCGSTDTRCNHFFQKLGRALVPSGPAVDVVSSRNQKYFQRWGRVVAYDPVEIPDPDVL